MSIYGTKTMKFNPHPNQATAYNSKSNRFIFPTDFPSVRPSSMPKQTATGASNTI